MIKKISFLLGILVVSPAVASDVSLDTAIANTQISCGGISNHLNDIKKMAGINTVITGIGTAAGAGGVITGLVKASHDVKSASLSAKLKALESRDDDGNVEGFQFLSYGPEFKKEIDVYVQNIALAQNLDVESEKTELQSQLNASDKKSKTLGNFRTGMLATNTATNIASTIIASGNRVGGDVKTRVGECMDSIRILDTARMRARIEYKQKDSDPQMRRAKQISDACGKYNTLDFGKVNSKASGATIAGVVGIATGGAGTVTSAMANSEKVRSNDSVAGQTKEDNLNVASNVLAVGATGSSLVGTVFNAGQISAAKKIISTIDACEEALR